MDTTCRITIDPLVQFVSIILSVFMSKVLKSKSSLPNISFSGPPPRLNLLGSTVKQKPEGPEKQVYKNR